MSALPGNGLAAWKTENMTQKAICLSLSRRRGMATSSPDVAVRKASSPMCGWEHACPGGPGFVKLPATLASEPGPWCQDCQLTTPTADGAYK